MSYLMNRKLTHLSKIWWKMRPNIPDLKVSDIEQWLWETMTPDEKIGVLREDFAQLVSLFIWGNQSLHPVYLSDILIHSYVNVELSAGKTLSLQGKHIFLPETEKPNRTTFVGDLHYLPLKEKTIGLQNEYFENALKQIDWDILRDFIIEVRENIKLYLEIESINPNSKLYVHLSEESKKEVILFQIKRHFWKELGIEWNEAIEAELEKFNWFLLRYWKKIREDIKWYDVQKNLLSEYYELFIKHTASLYPHHDMLRSLPPSDLARLWTFFDIEALIADNKSQTILPEIEVQDIPLEWVSFIHSRMNSIDIRDIGLPRVNSIYKIHGPQMVDELLSEFGINHHLNIESQLKTFSESALKQQSYSMWLTQKIPEKAIVDSDVLQLNTSLQWNTEISPEILEKIAKVFAKHTCEKIHKNSKPIEPISGYVIAEHWWDVQWYAWDNGLNGNNFLSQSSDGTDVLYINLSDINIDSYLFIAVQCIHILETGEPIPDTELYEKIYTLYGRKMVEWVDTCTIENTDEYPEFIEHVIYPHSIGSDVAKSHVLMAGLPWMWKSQMTSALLREKTFSFNGKTLELDCITMTLKAEDIMNMAWGDPFFRQRILEISEKTWKHILVVIEDIDAVLFSEAGNPAAERTEQYLTNMLDGVWAFSNVTIVSNTNNLGKFTERLMRGGRFDVSIEFKSIQNIQIARSKIDEYIQRYQLQDVISDDYSEKLAAQFVWLTFSSISDYFVKVHRKKSFAENFTWWFSVTDEMLNEIFHTINVNRESLASTEREQAVAIRNFRDKSEIDTKQDIL